MADRISDGLWLTPEEIVIVGLDTEDGPEHPLYDNRINLPIEPGMVKTIKASRKAEQSITVIKRKDGKYTAVDGRQRTRAGRLANEQLRDEGAAEGDLVRLRCFLVERGAKQAEIMAKGLATNVYRKDDNALDLGEKCHHFLKVNGDTPEMREILCDNANLTEQRLERLLLLREADPAIHQAIKENHLSVTAAIFLAQIDPEEQRQKLEELKKQAKVDGEQVVTAERARQGLKEANGGIPTPSKKFVGKMLAELSKTNVIDPKTKMLIMYIRGEVDEGKLPKEYRAVAQQIRDQSVVKRKSDTRQKVEKK